MYNHLWLHALTKSWYSNSWPPFRLQLVWATSRTSFSYRRHLPYTRCSTSPNSRRSCPQPTPWRISHSPLTACKFHWRSCNIVFVPPTTLSFLRCWCSGLIYFERWQPRRILKHYVRLSLVLLLGQSRPSTGRGCQHLCCKGTWWQHQHLCCKGTWWWHQPGRGSWTQEKHPHTACKREGHRAQVGVNPVGHSYICVGSVEWAKGHV